MRLSTFLIACVLALSSCAIQEKTIYMPRFTTQPPPQAPMTNPANIATLPVVAVNTTTVKVALLLPLTGEAQELGQSMLDSAMLALNDKYLTMAPEKVTARIVLLPKDTGSSPAAAAAAAKQAIDQGASLIIGPLFSQSVAAAAPIAKAAHVPMIALSNNRSVAGGGVFVFGFLPEQQVSRVLNYALGHGVTTMASIAPNDAYGNAVTDNLSKSLNEKGMNLVASELYAKSLTNQKAALKRLTANYATEPFGSLFIAEDSEQATQMVRRLPEYGVQKAKLRLLGTGLWDETKISRTGELVGGWFASAPPNYYDNFERRFKATYSYDPKRLSSLAYDAVTLVADLALLSGAANYGNANLMNEKGFVGPANGMYRFLPDGTVERALAIMEITPVGNRMIDPAPREFKPIEVKAIQK